MLSATQRQKLEQDFVEVEASFRMEGIDPAGDPSFELSKVKILSGEWTPEDALAFLTKEASAHLQKAS